MNVTKKTKYTIPILAAISLCGCGTKLPECGNEEVIKLVKEIIINQVDIKDSSADQIIIENIETKSTQEKPLKTFCSANISWKIKPETTEILTNISGISFLTPDLQKLANLHEFGVGALLSVPNNPFLNIGKESLLEHKNLLGPLIGIKSGLEKLVSSYPYKFENSTISFSNKKIQYTIRISEDKENKGRLFVETESPSAAINLIKELDSLPQFKEAGKKYLLDKKQ